MKYIAAYFVSIIVVVLSMFTVENFLNPLFWIIMFGCGFGFEQEAELYGGIILQSVVSLYIIYKCIFKKCFTKKTTFIISLAIMAIFCFARPLESYLYSNVPKIYDEYFYRVYDYCGFPTMMVFLIAQCIITTILIICVNNQKKFRNKE